MNIFMRLNSIIHKIHLCLNFNNLNFHNFIQSFRKIHINFENIREIKKIR